MSDVVFYCAITATLVTGINAALVVLFVKWRKAKDTAIWQQNGVISRSPPMT